MTWQLPKVDCKYAAPLGRGNSRELIGVTRLNKVALNGGGYDSGGAYWGTGEPLWCAQDSEGNELFLRSATRATAKAALKKAHPRVRFYR
jgi:hypothetical protein